MILACAVLFALSAKAQDTTKQQMNQYKDPTVAQLFGVLFTGGGHIYAGEVGKELLLMGIGGGATALGLYATLDQHDDCHPSDCPDQTNFTPLYVGAAVRPAYNQGPGLALRMEL